MSPVVQYLYDNAVSDDDYNSNTASVVLEAGTSYPSRHIGPPRLFGWVCVANLVCFQSCVVFFLRSVSCVHKVASVSGLSMLDCPFGFLWRLFIISHINSQIHILKYNVCLSVMERNSKYEKHVFLNIYMRLSIYLFFLKVFWINNIYIFGHWEAGFYKCILLSQGLWDLISRFNLATFFVYIFCYSTWISFVNCNFSKFNDLR